MMTLERNFTLTGAARRSLHHTPTPVKCASGRFTLIKPKWHTAILNDLTATRELLDRLEHAGRTRRELRILDDTQFEVRWCDPCPSPTDGPH